MQQLDLPRASGEPLVSLEARGSGEQKANSKVTLKIKGSFGYPQGKVEGERSPVHHRAAQPRGRGRARSPRPAARTGEAAAPRGPGGAVRRHGQGFDTKPGGSEQRAPMPPATLKQKRSAVNQTARADPQPAPPLCTHRRVRVRRLRVQPHSGADSRFSRRRRGRRPRRGKGKGGRRGDPLKS